MSRWIIALCGLVVLTQSAMAFPPTVVPSPGYDRALAESRRALREPPAFVEPGPQLIKPLKPRRKHRR